MGIYSAGTHAALPASTGDEPLGISGRLAAAARGGGARDFRALFYAGAAHYAAVIRNRTALAASRQACGIDIHNHRCLRNILRGAEIEAPAERTGKRRALWRFQH